MVTIANPIYDSVFKFLLEDNRVARILLSALLKKDLSDLEMQSTEYTNSQKTRISFFRLDFTAKIKDDKGVEQLVLIELQKTWLSTETLRFRQYLGTQYLSERNIPKKDNPKGFGLPIITIYILGHKLGDLQQPVVYVRRRYLDYEDIEITEGVPDPFIESLTHDSIIVQVPYLKGRSRNRLERLLRVFDQASMDSDDPHLLNIDEEDMQKEELLIVDRLMRAAISNEVRRHMSVEDEFLSEIEARDTTLMQKDKELMQKDKELKQKNKELQQKDTELQQKDTELQQKVKMLSSAVHALFLSGKNKEEIAAMLSIPMEEVGVYLESE